MIIQRLICCSVLLCSIVFSGCGEKDDSSQNESADDVKFVPNLLRIDVDNVTDLNLRRNVEKANLADTETVSMDVDIKSLKYPVASVHLNNANPDGNTTTTGDLSVEIYKCDDTVVEECLVELTGTSLSNLISDAKGAKASIGTYTAISIGICPEGIEAKETYFKMTAEATIAGTKYYTNTTNGLSTTGPAQEVTFTNGGGCGSNIFLPEPLEITSEGLEVPEDSEVVAEDEEGEELEPVTSGYIKGNIPIRLYFDLANAAYASGGTSNSGAAKPSNNCFGSSAQTPYICLNFPSVIGTVNSQNPIVTRMLLNNHTIWGFYQVTSGKPFGIYQRVYYTGEEYSGLFPESFIGPTFKKPNVSDAGLLSFDSYNDGRYFKVTNFKLEDHTGTFDWTGNNTEYEAVKLP